MHCTWEKAEWAYCGVATLFELAFWRTSRLFISSQSLQMKQQMQPMTSNFQSACATWNTICGWLKRGWACWSRKNAFYHWLCVQVFSKLFQNTHKKPKRFTGIDHTHTPSLLQHMCTPFQFSGSARQRSTYSASQTGLTVLPRYLYMRASSDGLIINSRYCKDKNVLEIKCPFSID